MLNILIFMLTVSCFAAGFPEVDKLVNDAIKRKVTPGAIVTVGNNSGLIGTMVYGKRDLSNPNTIETIYDLASLTKTFTATSIMILEEDGKLKITDKVSQYLPEFAANGKGEVTLEDLLRHRSGLISGLSPLSGETFEDYIQRVSRLSLSYKPRTQMVYSDLNAILLGVIVQKISGRTLSEFADENIFSKLKMSHTGYEVDERDKHLCAPTLSNRVCVPHDPTAFHFFPKNLGHAGIFSTAEDLSRFVRMYLNEGTLDGVTILKRETVRKMTTLPKGETRGLGFDLTSPYSNAPRGEIFPAGLSYGHTGYTGTAYWVDIKSQTFYVFLTNRVLLGEQNAEQFKELRKGVSTRVARVIYGSSSRKGKK